MSNDLSFLENIVCRVESSKESGTGFFISNKYIMSVYHIIEDTENIQIHYQNQTYQGHLIDLIDDYYKKLDIAIIEVPLPISNVYENIKLISAPLSPNTSWISRGFPKNKLEIGENLFHKDNTINQQLQALRESKYDLILDHKQKFDSYEGLSGAPIIVNSSIVGIINMQLTESGSAKELRGLSTKYFIDLLQKLNIGIEEKNLNINTGTDTVAIQAWNSLQKPNDIRNFREKIIAVCNDFSDRKINKYNNNLVLGKAEQAIYDDRDIRAVKYIVFDKCQDRLIDFYDTYTSKTTLTKTEVEKFIINYIEDAKTIINDKKQVYKYPKFTDDFIEKIVLDLIDECFLAFDEEGIYDV